MSRIVKCILIALAVTTFIIGAMSFETVSAEEKKHDSDSHAHNEGEEHEKDEHDQKTENHASEGEGHGHGHAEEGHEEEGEARAGPGLGVTEANRKDGLKLSDKALKTLDIKLAPVSSTQNHEVPTEAMVYFKDEAGIYRFRDGWFKLVETKPLKKSGRTVSLSTSQLKPGDQIVVSGVALLRVAELETWGGSGDGHGH